MTTRLKNFSPGSNRGFYETELLVLLVTLAPVFFGGCGASASSLGIFDNSSDIGLVERAGSARFNQSSNEYQITGGGANIWGEKDAFQYLWRRDSGDLSLTAKIRWIGEGKNAHRKAGWMIRQSLTPSSPYADAVVHGDGLISLQFRKTKGGPTEEIKSPISAPAFVRFERSGQVFSLCVSKDGKVYQPAGSISVPLKDPVHVGLVVCSHDDTTTETAVFSHVDIKCLGTHRMEDRIIESSLETISVESSQRQVVYRSRTHFEAPNWSGDGKYLLLNSGGRLYTISASGGKPMQLNTGFADHCNNDHGFSPDSKMLAISHRHKGDSLIYIMPSSGGSPRQITDLGPSYWHGWSPDSKYIAFVSYRLVGKDGEN
ncbi:MAG: TolB family protein [Planctomycetota bacterium]|jgi:regulation of enolase protein 1 (concanavalin A-like superfamily)